MWSSLDDLRELFLPFIESLQFLHNKVVAPRPAIIGQQKRQGLCQLQAFQLMAFPFHIVEIFSVPLLRYSRVLHCILDGLKVKKH